MAGQFEARLRRVVDMAESAVAPWLDLRNAGAVANAEHALTRQTGRDAGLAAVIDRLPPAEDVVARAADSR